MHKKFVHVSMTLLTTSKPIKYKFSDQNIISRHDDIGITMSFFMICAISVGHFIVSKHVLFIAKFIGTSILTSKVRLQRPYCTLSMILVFINCFICHLLVLPLLLSNSGPQNELDVGIVEESFGINFVKKDCTSFISIDYFASSFAIGALI